MDATRFDDLTRWFDTAMQRRAIGLFGASALGGIIAIGPLLDAEGKKRRKKKKCAPCRKKKKGKCKKHKPDGMPCGEGKICQSGSCIDIPCDPPCTEPAVCVDGACVFPDCDPECTPPATCVEGTCVCPEEQTCGDVCCPGNVQCNEELGICLCDGKICTCPDDGPVCAGGQLGGCCLAEDTCDPEVGCVTETCSAQNAFGTLGWASCNGNPGCSCFLTADGGDIVCAGNTFNCPFEGSQCANDDACDEGAVCVDVTDCDPLQGFLGVCVPLCAT